MAVKRIALCILAGLLMLGTCASCASPTPASSTGESSETSSSSSSAPTTSNGGDSIVKYCTYDNPLNDPVDPAADSGEKGEIYLVIWSSIAAGYTGDSVQQYDALGLISCLQGILNREAGKPVMYLNYIDTPSVPAEIPMVDMFWYKYLRREGKLLYGYKQVLITTMDQFIEVFGEKIKEYGLVEWDFNVPATSNVAISVCSATNALPVRAGGAFTKYIKEKTGAVTKVSLEGKFTGKGTIPDTNRKSTGSAKCDAYIWAMELYLDKCGKGQMGYLLDAESWAAGGAYYPDLNNCFLATRDYLVMNRAFVFDLSPWADETPCDDPNQPLGTDYRTLTEILSRQYDRNQGKIWEVVGFVPWHRKYTNYMNKGKHEGVASEWEFSKIINCYNAILEADTCDTGSMSNASVYCYSPIRDSYDSTKPTEKLTFDPNKKYIMMYIGDYDTSDWLKKMLPEVWNEGEQRGRYPLNWAFGLNLVKRIPMVFDYIYDSKTSNDYFVGGSTGAGYMVPYMLTNRVYSDKTKEGNAWVEYAKPYYERFNMDFTGFIVNCGQPFTDAEKELVIQFSPKGGIHTTPGQGFEVYKGAVFLDYSMDLPESNINQPKNIDKNVSAVLNLVKKRQKYNFYMVRSVCWTAEEINKVIEKTMEKDSNIVYVDAETFADLGLQAAAYYGELE